MTLFDFLSLKNDVNVPSESNKQKNILMAFWSSIAKIADSPTESLIPQPVIPEPLILEPVILEPVILEPLMRLNL